MDHLAKGELSSFDSGRGLWGEGGGEGFYLKGEGFVGFSRIFQGEKEGRKEGLWEGGGEEVMISVWNFV